MVGEDTEHSRYSETTYIKNVEVYWTTGPRKGTKSWRDTDALVNYDAYKQAIFAEIKDLEDNEKEATKTGM